MLIWPFLGKNSYFWTVSYSNSKPISYYFTGKLGNLGYLGRLKVAKKVRNNQKNIKKVAKTPYFSPFLGFSPGSIERIGWKSFHKFGFARSSTSCDRFGCPFSAGLILKKTALCVRPSVMPNMAREWEDAASHPICLPEKLSYALIETDGHGWYWSLRSRFQSGRRRVENRENGDAKVLSSLTQQPPSLPPPPRQGEHSHRMSAQG